VPEDGPAPRSRDGAGEGSARGWLPLLVFAAIALGVGFVVGRRIGEGLGEEAAEPPLPVTFHPAADAPPFDPASLPAAAGILGDEPIAMGEPLPDFELARLGAPEPQRLSDLRGRPVVLNFWATWCAPCRAEMPILQAVYDDLSDEGLEILAIDVGEEPAIAASFVRSLGLGLPILFDETEAVADRYRISSFPVTYMVDREGRLRSVMRGAYTSEEQLREAVDHLMEGGSSG